MNRLTKLTIENSAFTDGDTKDITIASNLKELNLIWNIEISEEGIKDINTLSYLEKLNLNGSGIRLAPTSFNSLGRLKSLVELQIENSPINNNTLVLLCRSLKELRVLSVSGCRNLSDNGIVELSQVSNIVSLNLNYTNITNRSLTSLSQSKTLAKLRIGSTLVTDEGLVNLSKTKSVANDGHWNLLQMTCLLILDVTGSNISKNEVLEYLEKVTKDVNIIGP